MPTPWPHPLPSITTVGGADSPAASTGPAPPATAGARPAATARNAPRPRRTAPSSRLRNWAAQAALARRLEGQVEAGGQRRLRCHTPSASSEPMKTDDVIRDFTSSQHALVTWNQLRRAGVSRSAARHRLALGVLERLTPTVLR